MEFVGEPQQRWQEWGVPFYFISFSGSIGGRKVRVQDCRPIQGGQTVGRRSDVACPSSIQSVGPNIDDFPIFPTQHLGDEDVAPENEGQEGDPHAAVVAQEMARNGEG